MIICFHSNKARFLTQTSEFQLHVSHHSPYVPQWSIFENVIQKIAGFRHKYRIKNKTLFYERFFFIHRSFDNMSFTNLGNVTNYLDLMKINSKCFQHKFLIEIFDSRSLWKTLNPTYAHFSNCIPNLHTKFNRKK